MNTDKQLKLLYTQMFGSSIFIITIIVSIILTYNTVLSIEGKNPLFRTKEENKITLTNRVAITAIVILFAYISYEFYKSNIGTKNEDISTGEFTASIFSLVSGLILTYTTIQNVNRKNGTNTDVNIPIF